MIDAYLFQFAKAARERQLSLAERAIPKVLMTIGGPDGPSIEWPPPTPEMQRMTAITDAWVCVCAALATLDQEAVRSAQRRMNELCQAEVDRAKEPTCPK